MQALLHEGNEQRDGDSDPDLRCDSIVRCAEDPLDLKVLFDPLEE